MRAPGAGEDEALANIFAGGAIVAGGECIERVTDAVHIIEELAENAAPGLGLGEGVIGHHGQAAAHIAL